MIVSFVVPGSPQGKARPRFRRTPYGVTTYTPKETQQYEKFVRDCYDNQCGKRKLQGAIEAKIVAQFSVPKSTTKKKRAELLAGNVPYTIKPDTDNIGKIIADSINGIAYDDDKQVSRLIVEKVYAEEPMVIVTLKEIEKL